MRSMLMFVLMVMFMIMVMAMAVAVAAAAVRAVGVAQVCMHTQRQHYQDVEDDARDGDDEHDCSGSGNEGKKALTNQTSANHSTADVHATVRATARPKAAGCTACP